MSPKAKFYVLLVATFALGLVLAFFPWTILVAKLELSGLGRTDEVMHKIGDALLIAPILALAVDKAAKLELLKEFAKDVSSHIIGRQLPESMREYIRAYLDVEFLRSAWHVTYEISPWEAADGSIVHGYVRLATKSVYTMHNLTPHARSYLFRYEVEDSWFPQVGETTITHASARHPNGAVEFDWADKPLQHEVHRADDLQYIERPVTIPAAEKWQFIAESTECFRDSSTCPPFNAFYAVEATTIVVRYPKAMFTVNLTLTLGDVKEAAAPPTETSDETTWKLTKPILPGQGFVVTWRRQPSPSRHSHKPAAVQT